MACYNPSAVLELVSDQVGIGLAFWTDPQTRRLPPPFDRGVEVWWVSAPATVVTAEVDGRDIVFRNGEVLVLRSTFQGAFVLNQVARDRTVLRSTHQQGVPIVVWDPTNTQGAVLLEFARSLDSNARLVTANNVGDIDIVGHRTMVPCAQPGLEVTGSVPKPKWPLIVAILGVLGVTVTGVAVVRARRRREVAETEERWVFAGAQKAGR